MADLKMLHYKQIQYEFCSKEHVFFLFVCFFSPGNNTMQRMTQTVFVRVLYNNGKILGPDESTEYNHSL